MGKSASGKGEKGLRPKIKRTIENVTGKGGTAKKNGGRDQQRKK